MKKRTLEEFAEIASDWFWETDENHFFTYISGRFEEVTGVPRDAIIGRNRREMALEKQEDPGWRQHAHDLDLRRPFRNLVYCGVNPVNGANYWVRSSGRPRYDDDGRFLGFYGVAAGITDEVIMRRTIEEANQRLAYFASHDPLTGLANRRRLDEIFAALSEKKTSVAVLLADLDQFKPINDEMGHATGDAVLREVACLLADIGVDCEAVARVGGDEFVLVCHPRSAASIAEAIIAALTEPMRVDGQEIRIGASVGYAAAADDDWAPNDLLHKADIALYEAKKLGRNRACAYSPVMEEMRLNTMRLGDEIVEALEEGGFYCEFQPQFDLTTGRIVGVEAQSRWRHPRLGVLTPEEFEPLAADRRLLGEIDRVILDQVLTASTSISARFDAPPRISVNVSRQRLLDPNLLPDIDRLAPTPPTRLAFEVAEAMAFERRDGAIGRRLAALRERGFELEIDNFGANAGALCALQALRPARLKICGDLVDQAVTREAKRRIVRAIVRVGETMEIGIVGEGAETEAHARLLADAGCREAQGFLFSRPISFNELMELLEAERTRERREAPDARHRTNAAKV